jgi:hypothetical protein
VLVELFGQQENFIDLSLADQAQYGVLVKRTKNVLGHLASAMVESPLKGTYNSIVAAKKKSNTPSSESDREDGEVDDSATVDFAGKCYNCGEKGHQVKDCTQE